MKLADPRNPVRFGWLKDQGFRLDSGPYVSGAYDARKILERIPRVQPLRELTTGHNGGIFNGPKFSRLYTNDPEWGIPFLGSADMLESDFTYMPLLHKNVARQFPYLEVQPGMTMITCSGTVGRTTYVRPDMNGFWSSQHTMKVNPNTDRILPGYLYAFLQSRFGVPMIVGAAYGAIVQHIEPHQLVDLPVPRFASGVEEEIHRHIDAASNLRAKVQAGIVAATRDLFDSAGFPELLDLHWHDQPRDIAFTSPQATATSLRALNFSPRALRLAERIRGVPHRTLGCICEDGTLRTGARFKRVDADPGFGVRLIGQRQAFWDRPEGRWISPNEAPADIHQSDETVLIAAHGMLSETEVYGRSIFVTGTWLQHAFSQDFVRVVSGQPDISGAYLFAFLRSEVALRLLRSMSVGGKQQEYHTTLLREMPVPECTPADRERITETVRQAYRWRDEAAEMEDQAQELLEAAVRDATGADLGQYGGLALRSLETEADGSGDG